MATKVSKSVGNARLTKLALFLLALPEGHFDYGLVRAGPKQTIQKVSCGTTACAMGWTPNVPCLRKAGVVLKVYTSEEGTDVCDATIRLGRNYGFDAAAKLFGISLIDAYYLFDPFSERPIELPDTMAAKAPAYEASAKDVAMHILQYVAKRP